MKAKYSITDEDT
jgi:hypothetical protein